MSLYDVSISFSRETIAAYMTEHLKANFTSYYSVFVGSARNKRTVEADKSDSKIKYKKTKYEETLNSEHFPPPPVSDDLRDRILKDFVNECSPDSFLEVGCAMCGELVKRSTAVPLESLEARMEYLKSYKHVTRKERFHESDLVEPIDDVVLDRSCNHLCPNCARYVKFSKIPKNALANGLWIGDIPDILKSLTWVEKRLIARVRVSCYLGQMSSGHFKIKGNVIAFGNPIPKVYNILPPPIAELNQVLAIVLIGPSQLKDEELKRTPLLVRRNVVAYVLRWLKLNHLNYDDIEISEKNLNDYPENGIPLVSTYRYSDSNKSAENTSVDDKEIEEGVSEGECPFIVHGLIGDDIVNKGWKAITALAVRNLKPNSKILAVGHDDKPESIFANPSLYPQIFPWLFPYGLGGIQNSSISVKISPQRQKAHFLLYHDKRFQTDKLFPIVSFNHEQIRSTSTGSFLLTKKTCFDRVVRNILSLDSSTLSNLADRLSQGEHVTPTTEEEKKCFALLKDIDHVSSNMDGALAGKKKQRTELWSLLSYHGAPSWFVTIAPADKRHPIALYYASETTQYDPIPLTDSEQYYRIAQNPVAGARFFHFIVNAFIKHILGIGTNHPGVFGKTLAYYGTVEQQGRLMLHLHLIIWIVNALSPQEIRDRLLANDSSFRHELLSYLESSHTGDYLHSSHADVKRTVDNAELIDPSYNPLESLPQPPPTLHHQLCNDCGPCQDYSRWHKNYEDTINHVLFKVNYHQCNPKVCMNNKYKTCKARFPRETRETTEIDPTSGSILLRKSEAWLNTYTPIITYLLRCNMDTTSLLSGTSVKAALAYITDYVSKTTLSTHVVFETLKTVFDTSDVILSSDKSENEKAKKIITHLVNSLIGKLEIGAPMASMYILGNPDHYTNQTFATIHWKSFVDEVLRTSHEDSQKILTDNNDPTVVIGKKRSGLYAVSPVDDYIYRPSTLNHVSLFQWVNDYAKFRCRKRSDEIEHEGTPEPPETSDILDIDRHSPEIDSGNESDDPGISLFQKPHPQRHTYRVSKENTDHSYVPNFIGGPLPRRDVGDYEYYCVTMLTLFKPWRNGKDLRDENISWSDTFRQTPFDPRFLQIMKNFNLKYECLDARHDFAANRKSPSSAVPINDDFDEDPVTEGGPTQNEMIADEVEFANDFTFNNIGRHTSSQNFLMAQMKFLLDNTGWTTTTPCKSIHIRIPRMKPSLFSSEEWKNKLDRKQEQIIEDRRRSDETVVDGQPRKKRSRKNEKNVVKLMPLKYLSAKFNDILQEHTNLKQDIVIQFTLNEHQERAFRIISNHLTSPSNHQLLMYVGGMAGTGKSQVIRAVTYLFDRLDSRNQLALLAPTGSAASLIGGSTYHSFLGINDRGKLSLKRFAALKAKTEDVQYIILDEVSMLGLRDLYKISAQLSKLKNNTDAPYGGVNIIFAGDFAQLPPPMKSSPLYADVSSRNLNSQFNQETCIAKSLWLQTTAVVILRDNMRQRNLSSDDQKLRTCLQNMRYKACTEEDIHYLHSRTVSQSSPVFMQPHLRYVSIITALNAQRDQINSSGVLKYASDTQQQLAYFYSIDTLSSANVSRTIPRSKTNSAKKINDHLQEILWNLPPSASDHVPGIISLCIGMPVMIKYNQATECCVTNGAEGVVVDWLSSINIKTEKPVLKSVFVLLTNPAQDISIDDLPINVVPISCETKNIVCTLPNDDKIRITRTQPPIIPNFAMTDYASQGRTRLYNVVHLTHCRTHQSYYTCLSRSSTSENTYILNTFNENTIKGGLSGWLRQEFRDLEMLDEITKLKYEDRLPEHISSHTRNVLIHLFKLWKGINYLPPNMHPSLCASKQSPSIVHPPIQRWRVLPKQVNQSHQHIPTASTTTREGTQWKQGLNSCAYDSLITILWNIFEDYGNVFPNIRENHVLTMIQDSFYEKRSYGLKLECIRDRLTETLNAIDPNTFPSNPIRGIDLDDLLETVFHDHFILHILSHYGSSLQNCISHLLKNVLQTSTYRKQFANPPKLVLVRLHDTSPTIPKFLSLPCMKATPKYKLTAVIYHGSFHFTARYIDVNNTTWYHDGIQTKSYCEKEQDQDRVDYRQTYLRTAALLLYFKLDSNSTSHPRLQLS